MSVTKNWGRIRTAKLQTQLEAELNKVRAVAPPPPTVDPIYRYLEHVYQLRCEVGVSPEMQQVLKAHHKKHYPRTLQQYAGVIIELTAGDHITRNMKNKYFTAVEYAHKEAIPPKDFIDFIHEHGGLNKCGELSRKKYGGRAVIKQPQEKAKK